MTISRHIFSGVLVPVLTPFGEELRPEPGLYIAFCRSLLEQGAGGLAVFGTTSEANSMTIAERRGLLAALVEGGIEPKRLMPGTGASAIPDAVELTRDAVEAGAGGVLLLPPFYYKAPPEDGVFAYFSEVIERVGDRRLKVFLYHIPQISGVPVTPEIVARLVDRYGATIAGLKDSSGDWSNTATLLNRFPQLSIFPGSERFLMQGLAAGAPGCISATANYDAGLIAEVIKTADGPERERLARRMVAIRSAFEKHPVIPALKFMQARRGGNPVWRAVRPPLRPLSDAAGTELLAALEAAESD
ncbi:MAG TPA: dihydrodipicolinate synthase family protein [Methylomirabilota bacterium]|jgi:4-hydroxy-tetrahydrodipicolinate synthase|nr:dihydrodipicolinate synthase family protein [Methylomirabilota bacterium]